MRALVLTGLMAITTALSGCELLLPNHCLTGCGPRTQRSSSLVEFLYPDGGAPPPRDAIPELHVPLRVGLAFLPSKTPGLEALSAAQREELLARIREHFRTRKFIADIVIIPDYYLSSGRKGFDGLAGLQRLYSLDLVALVSYDQLVHEDENRWSLGYLTIVGAYVLQGNRHDVSTLIDLAVVDPATRSLVLRAGGTDTRHGSSTRVDEAPDLRRASAGSFSSATEQMIGHFDTALTDFESEVRAGKANVRVVTRGGAAVQGGGGGLGWPEGMLLASLLVLRQLRRSAQESGCATRLQGAR